MNALQNNIFINAAEHFGTPTFLYDLNDVRKRYLSLRNQFISDCSIYYSMKANPLLGICQYMQSLGLHCEVSSRGEFLTALKAGFLPSQIIFVGPGKRKEELNLCVNYKIKAIVCESIEELQHVNSLAKKQHFKMPVLIRLNPHFSVPNAPIKMSGVASQFGIEVNTFKTHFTEINNLSYIDIMGLHIYSASRMLDAQAIQKNIENILLLADELSSQFQFQWRVIDIGGGFGVPYFKDELSLDIHTLCSNINQLFYRYKAKYYKTQFILELGRYLIAESGYLISTVQSIKENQGKKFIVVDAGMHCQMAATGIGSFVHRNFPFHHIATHHESFFNIKNTYDVVGPLCTPGDVLLREVRLANVSIQDHIILCHSGAYGLSASPIRFLSHGAPAEVMFFNNQFYLARRRETENDLWVLQNDWHHLFQHTKENVYVQH